MRLLLAVCILATSASALVAQPEIKGTPQDVAAWLDGVSKPVILSGEAEIKAQADQAFIRLVVHTDSKSLGDALTKNLEIRSKILADLKKSNIPDDAVEVSRFSSTPNRGWFGDKPKSYTVENLLTIRITKESEFQSVAAIIDTRPEVRYEGIEFKHSQKDAFKAKALKQASEQALEKKAMIEQTLGVKLQPKTISENGALDPQRFTAGIRKEGAAGYTGTLSMSAAPMALADQGPAGFGEVVYKASVRIECIVVK
jgi:uncharacterized protein YggE